MNKVNFFSKSILILIGVIVSNNASAFSLLNREYTCKQLVHKEHFSRAIGNPETDIHTHKDNELVTESLWISRIQDKVFLEYNGHIITIPGIEGYDRNRPGPVIEANSKSEKQFLFSSDNGFSTYDANVLVPQELVQGLSSTGKVKFTLMTYHLPEVLRIDVEMDCTLVK